MQCIETMELSVRVKSFAKNVPWLCSSLLADAAGLCWIRISRASFSFLISSNLACLFRRTGGIGVTSVSRIGDVRKYESGSSVKKNDDFPILIRASKLASNATSDDVTTFLIRASEFASNATSDDVLTTFLSRSATFTTYVDFFDVSDFNDLLSVEKLDVFDDTEVTSLLSTELLDQFSKTFSALNWLQQCDQRCLDSFSIFGHLQLCKFAPKELKLPLGQAVHIWRHIYRQSLGKPQMWYHIYRLNYNYLGLKHFTLRDRINAQYNLGVY